MTSHPASTPPACRTHAFHSSASEADKNGTMHLWIFKPLGTEQEPQRGYITYYYIEYSNGAYLTSRSYSNTDERKIVSLEEACEILRKHEKETLQKRNSIVNDADYKRVLSAVDYFDIHHVDDIFRIQVEKTIEAAIKSGESVGTRKLRPPKPY